MALKRSSVVILVGLLAVTVAAVASYSLYNYLTSLEERQRRAEVSVPTATVVVASSEIPVGATIQAIQMKSVEWPTQNVPPGAFNTPGEAVGRVALYTFMAGEPITEARLMPKQGMTGILTYKIPEGHRAMTVAVDQVSGVAGFITPGSTVDVILTTTPPGATQAISKIVLQSVQALATGQVIEQKEDKPVLVPTVTVSVTPEEAEKLAIATAQGRLQLILRKAGDETVSTTTGENVSKVVGLKKGRSVTRPIVVYKEPRRDVTTVEVLRRNQKSTETFPKE